MFFPFLNNDEISVDEKYLPFVLLFEEGLSSLLLEEHTIILSMLSISKEKLTAFIKKEVFVTGHIPTFIELPANSWIDYYIEVHLTSIIEEAERLYNEQDSRKKRQISHRLDADALILKIQQSDKFRIFLDLLDAYNEGESVGEIRGLRSAIIRIFENKFGQLPEMIYDTIYSINEIDQVREVLEGALSCKSILQFEDVLQCVCPCLTDIESN